MSNGHVTLNVENKIATIEFFHPASNSLPGAILHQLANTITEADRNPEVHVMVVRSAGDRAFCAGASFDELLAIDNTVDGLTFFSGFAGVINAMRKASKLIIGRIQGKTVGGGVGLASSFDYCFATKYASVKLSELAIGIGPFVVGPAVERKAGLSGMSELAINASEWRDAEWAREKGIFNEVFQDTEAMDKGISELSGKLAASNPDAMSELKRTFWAGTEHWDELLSERAAVSGRLVLSTFTKNAINAFKKK